MTTVTDRVGRTFHFDQIRFRMDERLLQQAGAEVADQTKERAQLVFDRYCLLHLSKYGRNFEPAHFASGQLLPRFAPLYESPRPSIVVTVEITEGPLLERYIGMPPDYVEQAFRLDPKTWVAAGSVISQQT